MIDESMRCNLSILFIYSEKDLDNFLHIDSYITVSLISLTCVLHESIYKVTYSVHIKMINSK